MSSLIYFHNFSVYLIPESGSVFETKILLDPDTETQRYRYTIHSDPVADPQPDNSIKSLHTNRLKIFHRNLKKFTNLIVFVVFLVTFPVAHRLVLRLSL